MPLAASAYTRHRHIQPAPKQSYMVAAQSFTWTFATTSTPVETKPVTEAKPLVEVSKPAASTPAGNICINYGYGGSQDNPATDLANLKSHGITCVRLAFNGQNSPQTEKLALQAKNLGFFVEIGNDGDPLGANYASGVVAEAKWAEANHIDQMSIGNETKKNSQTQAALAVLSCDAKKVAPNVTISYDTFLEPNGFDDIKAWADNKGCLDKLGLNTYANYQNTYQEAQNLLGAGHWYISEFNVDCDYGQCDTDAAWAQNLQKVWNTAKTWNVKTNFFAYRCDSGACNPHWGIMGHPEVMAVLGL